MTKPTGRPRGRPKTREYVTLMARMPLELADQARRYAGRKRQPLSEVLRDGLQLLLEQEADAPYYVYNRKEETAKVSDIKEDSSPSLEAPQARQPDNLSYKKEAHVPLNTPRPAIVSDTKDVSAATPPQKGRKPVLRQPILDMLREHPEGLTAVELKVYLQTDRSIGDTLQGMARARLIATHGTRPTVRYTLPATPQATALA